MRKKAPFPKELSANLTEDWSFAFGVEDELLGIYRMIGETFMKKVLSLVLALVCIMAFIGCTSTLDNKYDWKTTLLVEVDEDVLVVCYDVLDEKGFEYNKNDFLSVLLGNEIEYVALFEGIDKTLLDENDILVQFAVMRIVIDSKTNESLGSIPYA